MTDIIFPANTKETIDKIRAAIGREVTFVTEIEEDCPTCDIDPVTLISTDPFCTTCSGTGYIYSISGDTVLAKINWGRYDNANWITGGKYRTGICHLQVDYSEELKGKLGNVTYVLVDNERLRIKDIEIRGVPTINRILIDLDQD